MVEAAIPLCCIGLPRRFAPRNDGLDDAIGTRILGMIRDIYSYTALKEIDDEFYESLRGDLLGDAAIPCSINVLPGRFAGRNDGFSGELIQKSILLEKFLTKIFPIENELNEFYKQADLWNDLANFKLQFVQRRALRKYSSADTIIPGKLEQAEGLDGKMDPRVKPQDAIIVHKFSSMGLHKFAILVLDMLKNEAQYQDELDQAMRYVAYKAYIDPDHSVFILPKKLDFEKLVDPENSHYTRKNSMSEAHYCIYCHNQEKDHCRKGVSTPSSSGLTRGSSNKVMDPRLRGDDATNDRHFAHNPIGNLLSGCPLGQKISEMNYLYSKGNIIAALAVTMIDNPLVAATGDRVCNDCMKSCIYQKQEPVDIPCIETDMLRDVLRLPYGAEIYYLLTRWNPLAEYIATPNAPGKALVAGMGPAGFAMGYYLLRAGHKVTAIDSMKIQKLDEKFFSPILNWKETAGSYKPQGFGGVSEYGITDRWDKSNLVLIRMILERFPNFELKDRTKLGEDITLKEAAAHYDYIALCLGAGQPNLPKVKNADAKGVISAFDFLMERNVGSRHPEEPTGRRMDDVIAPVIVVGAGLTAIDSALEAISSLRGVKRRGNPWIASSPSVPRNDDEVTMAPRNDGDVTILYRKSMRASPSYRENHAELQIALDKGIKFTQNTNLESIELDESGRVKSVNGTIPVRTLIFAFGTGYNDQILLNEPDTARNHKSKIGIFGDLDPKYTGSVVKAIASSKDSYQEVSRLLNGDTR